MKTNNIDEKKEPKRLPVWACIPLSIVVLFIFIGLYGALVSRGLSLILGVEVRHPGVVGYIFVEGSMLLVVLIAAIVLPRLERRSFSDLGLSLKGHASGLWYGLLMAILLYLLGFGISVVLGGIEVVGFQFKPSDLLGSWVFFLLVMLFEEILIRGHILGRLLHTSINKLLALFISSALLTFIHIFNPEIVFLSIPSPLLAGMPLGVSYLYTQNLCLLISLYLFWNQIQDPILGCQVSRNNFMTSILILRTPRENVPDGGTFSSEGPLICIVFVTVFTILIA